MSVTVEKRCKACGTDVSQGRRSKDAAGNYLCEPCLRTARGRQQAGGTGVGTATMPQQPLPAGVKACANCGSAMGALQQTWDWQGHPVCRPCRELLWSETAEPSGLPGGVEPSGPSAAGGRDNGQARPGLPAMLSVGSPSVTPPAMAGVPAARSFLGRKVREYLIVAGLCLAGLIGMVVVINVFDGGDDKAAGSKFGPDLLVTLALWAVLGGVGWYWTGGGTHCPSCNRRRARVLIGSENLGVSRRSQTVRRRDKVRDASGLSGRMVGTIERDEQVTVERQNYAELYRCKYCGHEWAERTAVAV